MADTIDSGSGAALVQKAAAAIQKARHRSPNYPSIGLRAAVVKIEALYKAGGLVPLMKVTALKQMGFENAVGDSARVLSALKSFGLIEEVGDDRLKLAQRGIDIVARQGGDPQRAAALRSAASGPAIYRDLLTEFEASGVPPEATLKSELIAAKKFNPNAVDGFIADFKDTLEFSGLLTPSGLESSIEEQMLSTHDSVNAGPEASVTTLPPPARTQTGLRSGTLGTTAQGRLYSWGLSENVQAEVKISGPAQIEDLEALQDYVGVLIKSWKRKQEKSSEEPSEGS